MTKQELKDRTKLFAVNVFNFINTLCVNEASKVIIRQLLRSSSSVAANYRAVCRSKSDADFLNKLKVVDEESDESLFWLEMIKDLNIDCDKEKLKLLTVEANELVSIFSSAIKTMKSKLYQS